MLSFQNHRDFNAYLEKIDAGLRRDNVPIIARPLQALSRISSAHNKMEFNISNAMALDRSELTGYEGNVLTRRIIDWFDELYGDSLKMNFSDGKSIALVRGDPYLMAIPMFLGGVEFTYSVETFSKSGQTDNDGNTIVNVFDCLPDITEATVARVSRSEGFRLANELRANTYRFHKATKIRDYENTFDVRTDLDAAAQHIATGQDSYGISRWHSLQASEKAIKSILRCQNLEFPKTHDLYHLIGSSKFFGISPLALNKAMCPAEVRYEPKLSTLSQAVDAHHASLDICLEAANWIAELGKEKVDQRPEWVKEIN